MGFFQILHGGPWSPLQLAAAGSISGLLFWASIPGADVQLLAWICLIPCFLGFGHATPGALFAMGMVSGFISGLGRVYWITETLQLYGALPLPLALASNFFLILYLSLYPGIFFFTCSRFNLSSPFFPWQAASLWVLLEWVQTWLISGFPWMLLGYSQHLNLSILQIASLTGVYGLSFLIVLVNAGLARVIVSRSGLLTRIGPPALLLVGVLIWGRERIGGLDAESGAALKVGIVQGNIPQGEKWKKDRIARSTRRYVELTRAFPSDQLDLIVFPETALPFRFRDQYYRAHHRQILELARRLRTPMLVGSLEGSGGGESEELYNRAFLLDEGGDIHDFQDKVHLVPFGEYLPLAFLFQYLEGLTAESGVFAPGKGHKVLTLPSTKHSFGVFLCYESIFPSIARNLAGSGASFLINTTNDAWFGLTAAPYQHLAMAVLRAVETGRPVLRAANTGISGIIDPAGRIRRETGLFETAAFTVEIRPRTESTIYVLWGDSFLALCALFLAGASGPGVRRHFSRNPSRPGVSPVK